MKLFIPPLKTEITLTKEWNFTILCEPRNRTLWDLFHAPPSLLSIHWQSRRHNWRDIHLDIGDVLIVDRIYIRAGAESFNSVTFRGRVKHEDVIRNVRFWVSLSDANNIEGEVRLP